MARLAAILRALALALRRDQKSLLNLAGNNFFIVSLLLLQKAGGFIYLIMGLVLLFPLSTDPLRKIPASRLELWPLDRRERRLLRLASPWVNPMTWFIAALAIWAARGRVSLGLWGLAAGLAAAGFVLSELPGGPAHGLWRRVPAFPGPLNQLIRKNVREIFSTLDFYCALILGVAAMAFRIFGKGLPAEGLLALTILVVLALSSYAQCLFGLDGRGGLSRYRLLPLRGWQILAAKDVAFLSIAIVLTLPLAPFAGIGAALVALAVGHEPSVNQPRTQMRWRFSSGASLMYGLFQAGAMGMAAAGVFFNGAFVLALCAIAWALSLWWYGRVIDLVRG
jgi:hypothetical protein